MPLHYGFCMASTEFSCACQPTPTCIGFACGLVRSMCLCMPGLMYLYGMLSQAGLTLTEASTIFILDPPMEPGLEAQVAARVHRLGESCVRQHASMP